MRFFAALLLGTALAGPAFAMQDTRYGGYDARVRTVIYNEMNVVRIVGKTFTSTEIVFSPDEYISIVTGGDVGSGGHDDPSAWIVKTGDRDQNAPSNLLFIKPVEVRQQTNMQVTTVRKDGSSRSYQFDLVARDGLAAGSDKVADLSGRTGGSVEIVPYMVKFIYPEDARAAALAKQRASEAGASERLAESRLAVDYFYGPRNWRYVAWGSKAIEPFEVSDNGRLTAMRFPGNSPIPTIYSLAPTAGKTRRCGDDGGKFEQIVSYTMRADVAVIPATATDFCLRHGEEVLQVHNIGYAIGSDPGTGTTSPEVLRSVRGVQ